MASCKLNIEWQGYHSFLLYKKKYHKILCQIAKFVGFEGEYGLTIHLVNKDRIKSINFKYRKKNQVTDVLSFPLDPPRKTCEIPALLGDIFICKEKVITQAKEYNLLPVQEFEILLVHGFLHLFGFDHEKDPKKWHNTLETLCQKKIVSYNSINYDKRKTS